MTGAFLRHTHYGALLGPPDFQRTLNLVGFLLTNAHATILLVENLQAQPIGMIGAYASEHTVTGRLIAEELCWWVDPDYRAGRAGLVLLTAFENWARGLGCSVVKMTAPNQKTGHFYQRRGYFEVETAYAKVL